MTHAEYEQTPGLSLSALMDLAVSPLRFWYRRINPNRTADEPTPQMQFGSAVHCAVLEPEEFDSRYARALELPEGCLVTMEDLRAFLRDRGLTPKGTRKAEVIAQVQACDPAKPILEVLQERHEIEHAGKVIFGEAWDRIGGAVNALRTEPRFAAILARDHTVEQMVVRRHAETGVDLKGRLDFDAPPDYIVDIKTFIQKREKSIDQTILDAIWYEKYWWKAYWYAMLKGWPETWNGQFVLAFVESDPPHEVRLKLLRHKTGGQPNMYWTRAASECRALIQRYADLVSRFGNMPWREPQEVDPLVDDELPVLHL